MEKKKCHFRLYFLLSKAATPKIYRIHIANHVDLDTEDNSSETMMSERSFEKVCLGDWCSRGYKGESMIFFFFGNGDRTQCHENATDWKPHFGHGDFLSLVLSVHSPRVPRSRISIIVSKLLTNASNLVAPSLLPRYSLKISQERKERRTNREKAGNRAIRPCRPL